jgi:hypothetical protein
MRIRPEQKRRSIYAQGSAVPTSSRLIFRFLSARSSALMSKFCRAAASR